VPSGIECFLEELVDDVKVILECRRSEFAEVFDENVQKGADERKGI
jgi:transcriptional regulator CtsR